MNKRYRDCNNIPQFDNRCRLCKNVAEDVQHNISSCPLMFLILPPNAT